MAKPLVVVFARAPRYGAVKTRLARDIGAAEALRFYRSELARVLRRLARETRWETVLCVTPDQAGYARGLWSSAARLSTQGAGDLGRRMVRALRDAGPRPVVLIGSDIPKLRMAHLAAAFRALGSTPVVLAPATDGGYWLIGARPLARLRRGALDGVRWSSVHALEDSRERLPGAAVLDIMLDDVDEGAAYRRILG